MFTNDFNHHHNISRVGGVAMFIRFGSCFYGEIYMSESTYNPRLLISSIILTTWEKCTVSLRLDLIVLIRARMLSIRL